MHMLISAGTGHGKSYVAQAIIEENIPEYDTAVVLDDKGEFTGLVKAGLAKHYVAGERELEAFGPEEWATLLRDNPQLVVERRDSLSDEDWEQLADEVVGGTRLVEGTTFYGIDEAHNVYPEKGSGSHPEHLKWLLRTSRGEGGSMVAITQRLAGASSAMAGACMTTLLGGYNEQNDVDRLASITDYNEQVHKVGGVDLDSLPEDLRAEDAPNDGKVSLRKFRDDQDRLVGSEWVYADDEGTLERRNSRNLEPEAEHYGNQGEPIRMPDF